MAAIDQHNNPPPVRFEDFINVDGLNFDNLDAMDLFPSISPNPTASPSTQHSPNSPADLDLSFSPATPPQPAGEPFQFAHDTNIDPSLYEMLFKSMSMDPSSSLSVPPPVFAPFSSSSTSSGASLTPDSVFSPTDLMNNIDPTLVAPPAPPATAQPTHTTQSDELRSPPTHDEESDSEHDSDDEIIKPVKVGGKGRARKGTVASGGVAKRTVSTSIAATNALKEKAAQIAKEKLADEDWRPTPEEYKKMSSKEKRQLRNKISARNFRVRRKEYITSLEGEVAERDRLIDAIREELGSTKLENQALRQEVEALKRAMMEGRANPDLPPPAPLPATTSTPTLKRSSSRLAKPNTQKDLPTSPRVGARNAFWGGSNTPFGAGGITSVHATLVPEFKLPSPITDSSSSGSESEATPSPPSTPPSTSSTLPSAKSGEPENINPALNLPCFGGVGSTTPNPKFPLGPYQQPSLGSNFDAFAETNPFTLKTLDAYRMQLWGRMAREVGRRQAQQPQTTPPPHMPSPTSSGSSGLAGAMRPMWFQAPKAGEVASNKGVGSGYVGLGGLLSGKSLLSSPSSAASSLPTPPATPPSAAASLPTPTPQQALVAGLATQTLLSKLGGAFWDAFASRPSSSSSTPSAAAWDHDKVRRVLEGKAVVKIVDVDNELEGKMKGLSISSTSTPTSNATLRENEKEGCLSGWRKCAAGVAARK